MASAEDVPGLRFVRCSRAALGVQDGDGIHRSMHGRSQVSFAIHGTFTSLLFAKRARHQRFGARNARDAPSRGRREDARRHFHAGATFRSAERRGGTDVVAVRGREKRQRRDQRGFGRFETERHQALRSHRASSSRRASAQIRLRARYSQHRRTHGQGVGEPLRNSGGFAKSRVRGGERRS